MIRSGTRARLGQVSCVRIRPGTPSIRTEKTLQLVGGNTSMSICGTERGGGMSTKKKGVQDRVKLPGGATMWEWSGSSSI